MKRLFLCVMFLGAGYAMRAQTQASSVNGANYVNAGIGIGAFGLYGTGGLPVTASYEHGFSNNISAGVNFGIFQRTFDMYTKYAYTVLGLRGSYHFNSLLNVNNDKVDLYAGLGLLYRHYSVKYTGYGSYGGQVSDGAADIDFHAGARYLFAKNVGAFAEVGYGISALELGLSLKF